MEPYANAPDRQKEEVMKYLNDPFTNSLCLAFIKEVVELDLEKQGNFYNRINKVKRDLVLIGKECGSDVVFDLVDSAFEELGKKTEERFAELGDIKELLKEDKPTKKSQTTYTGKITISQLAEKRYGIKLNKQGRCACPFHSPTNSISFMFDDEKNRFHCFSCKESGNMVQFVKLMEEKNNGKS